MLTHDMARDMSALGELIRVVSELLHELPTSVGVQLFEQRSDLLVQVFYLLLEVGHLLPLSPHVTLVRVA